MDRYKVIKCMSFRIFDTETEEVMEEVPATYLFTSAEVAKKECERLNLLYNSAIQMVKDNYYWTRHPRTKRSKL